MPLLQLQGSMVAHLRLVCTALDRSCGCDHCCLHFLCFWGLVMVLPAMILTLWGNIHGDVAMLVSGALCFVPLTVALLWWVGMGVSMWCRRFQGEVATLQAETRSNTTCQP